MNDFYEPQNKTLKIYIFTRHCISIFSFPLSLTHRHENTQIMQIHMCTIFCTYTYMHSVCIYTPVISGVPLCVCMCVSPVELLKLDYLGKTNYETPKYAIQIFDKHWEEIHSTLRKMWNEYMREEP